jgi:hypothetical protein
LFHLRHQTNITSILHVRSCDRASNKFLWCCSEALTETCRVSSQNKFKKLVQLVGFIIKKWPVFSTADRCKFLHIPYEMAGCTLEEAYWKIYSVFGVQCLLLTEALPTETQRSPLFYNFAEME